VIREALALTFTSLNPNLKPSYPERQRDRPDEASATMGIAQGANSGRKESKQL